MENIITIGGKVRYQITLDPGVWIFDDRKIELASYFEEGKKARNELEEYTKDISAHWDREIIEGAILSPTIKTEKTFKKQKLLTGTFVIPFKPFLKNAEPLKEATTLIVLTKSGELKFDLALANEFVLGFSKDGKPLKENGPIYVYFGDGTNLENPLSNVKGFIIE
ncbi:peptidyl-prolyl cis-trans isomerase [Pseudoneobacillus sp. C159]